MKNLQIRFKDGAVFRGDSPTEIVLNMKNRNYFTAGKSIEEYMRGYAHRTILLFEDPSIDPSSPETFLESLRKSPEVDYFMVNKKEQK